MVGERLKTVFFAVILSAFLVIIITICIIFIPPRPCVHIDAIEDLQMLQVDDALLVTWEQPFGHGNCPMTYHIHLSNESHVFQSDETPQLSFEFFNVNFTPCVPLTISVYAVTHMRFGSNITGTRSSFTYFGAIGPVTNLQVLQENRILTAIWDPPEDSESCSLSYEVELEMHLQDEAQEPNVTFDTAFTFEEVDARPCVVYTVIVTPMGEVNAEETLRGQEEINAHFGEVGSVKDLQLELEESVLLISWSAPVDVEECQLEYLVTLSYQNEFIQEYATQINHHDFDVPNVAPCGVSNVSVTPLATFGYEEIRGSEAREIHVGGLGPVVNLELVQQIDGLFATWEAPNDKEYCGVITYVVVLQTGDGMIQENDVTYDNQFIFEDAELIPCTISTVTVTPTAVVNEGEITVTGVIYSNTHFAAVGPVQDLTFQAQPFGISWNAPANSDACILIYYVEIETRNAGATLLEFYPLENTPCYHYNATVTPLVQEDRSGPPQTETHDVPPATEIGPIQNPVIVEDVVVWDPPINAGVCEVTYHWTALINGVPSENQTTERFLEGLPPCSTPTITITASLEESTSEAVTLEVEVPLLNLNAVQNLEFLDDRVQWDAPLNAEMCPIVYIITHTSGSDLYEAVQEETYFLIDLQLCSHHKVNVIAFYEGSNGENITGVEAIAEIYWPNDATLIEQVQSLTVDVGGLVEWLPPDGVDTETCTVQYSILLDRGFDVVSDVLDVNYFQIPDVPCSDNQLTLYAVVNGFAGEQATVYHSVDQSLEVEYGPPQLVNFTVSFDSMTSLWRVHPMEINACEIVTFSVWINEDFRQISVADNAERTLTLEIPDLLPNKDYNVSVAVHVSIFPNAGLQSEHFLFTTDPAPLDVDETMKLTWDSPSPSNYEVIIQDNGPAHFLPSSCVENNPKESNHLLLGNTTEFLLTSYLPSRNYTILVTSETASENYSFQEVTPEAKPGVPSLSVEFRARRTQDDVTAVVSWGIPCDLNGKLVRFAVEMDDFKENVFAEDGREIYSIEIERLKRGTLYTVYVEVYLRAHRSDKGAITFETPGNL